MGKGQNKNCALAVGQMLVEEESQTGALLAGASAGEGRQVISIIAALDQSPQHKIALAQAALQIALRLPDRSPAGEDRSRYRQLIAKLYFEEVNVERALEILDQDLLDPALTSQQRQLTQRKLELLDPPTLTTKGRSLWEDNQGRPHRTRGPASIRTNGLVEYYLHGQLHREDGPAREWANGRKEWYQNDQLHRENGPARERTNGSKEWYQNGKLHRDNGPAIEQTNGYQEWWLNGQKHRQDGPAREWPDGRKEWYQRGKLHRDDGPAVEWADGYKAWWVDGKRHRVNGPAIERADGYQAWFKHGRPHEPDTA